MPGVVLSLLLAGAVLAPLVEGTPPGGRLNPPWRVVALPNQSLPMTRYTPEVVQGRSALRVEAPASYGNLVHELNGAAAPRTLRWSWRLQQPAAAAADLRRKAGDDVALKVCLSFDLPLAQVPFIDRQVLRLARAKSGEALPAATLCWVWASGEAQGSVVDNAYTRRVRYIVLRNAGDAQDTWFDESRNIAADFLRAFGDEAPAVPPLTAVLVGGDADNTQAQSVAHVTALRFEP
jgi:hypothetical protein